MILALCGRSDAGRDEAAVAVSARVGVVGVLWLGSEGDGAGGGTEGASSTAFLSNL